MGSRGRLNLRQTRPADARHFARGPRSRPLRCNDGPPPEARTIPPTAVDRPSLPLAYHRTRRVPRSEHSRRRSPTAPSFRGDAATPLCSRGAKHRRRTDLGEPVSWSDPTDDELKQSRGRPVRRPITEVRPGPARKRPSYGRLKIARSAKLVRVAYLSRGGPMEWAPPQANGGRTGREPRN